MEKHKKKRREKQDKGKPKAWELKKILGKVDTWWTADGAGGTALSCSGGGGERAVRGRRWRRLGGEVVLLVPTPSGSSTALCRKTFGSKRWAS